MVANSVNQCVLSLRVKHCQKVVFMTKQQSKRVIIHVFFLFFFINQFYSHTFILFSSILTQTTLFCVYFCVKTDANGCQVSCGEKKCQPCPQPRCVAPPAGCEYVPDDTKDEYGCKKNPFVLTRNTFFSLEFLKFTFVSFAFQMWCVELSTNLSAAVVHRTAA